MPMSMMLDLAATSHLATSPSAARRPSQAQPAERGRRATMQRTRTLVKLPSPELTRLPRVIFLVGCNIERLLQLLRAVRYQLRSWPWQLGCFPICGWRIASLTSSRAMRVVGMISPASCLRHRASTSLAVTAAAETRKVSVASEPES